MGIFNRLSISVDASRCCTRDCFTKDAPAGQVEEVAIVHIVLLHAFQSSIMIGFLLLHQSVRACYSLLYLVVTEGDPYSTSLCRDQPSMSSRNAFEHALLPSSVSQTGVLRFAPLTGRFVGPVLTHRTRLTSPMMLWAK